MHRDQHLTNFVLGHPWALTQPYADLVARVLARHIVGRVDHEALQAAAAKREQLPQPRRGGGVAIIPVHGVILPRAEMIFQSSGLVSLEALGAQIADAVKDSSVRTIVLDVDSPGGSIQGCTEFVGRMLAWRAEKPIVAVANFTMASAAYWIASAATEIVAPPSAQVGSIGVFTIHDSLAAALKMEGVERTYIYQGKHKVDGHEAAPLSQADQAQIQSVVDQAYSFFTADVARGRSVSVADVRAGFGEGRTVFGHDALALKMIDRVATLDDTIARLTPTSVSIAATDTHAPALQASDPQWCNEAYRALQELTL